MNDARKLIAEVHRRLLLGIGATAPIPEAEGELGAFLAVAANAPERETAWLHTLAVVTGWYRAGTRARALERAEVPQLPSEERACVTTGVAGLLDACLASSHAEGLVRTWLERVDAHGLCARPRHLPALLEHARRHVAVRSLVAKVVGARGVWLAAQHEPWSALLVPPARDRSEEDEHFETAPLAARRAVLERWRTHGEKAHARDRLEGVWKQERAKERATLLAAFRTGLDRDDEAFLEARLGDRSQEVRVVAADLLARLGGSAFAGRMRERVQRHLNVARSLLKTTLQVDLPEVLADDWKRDGIVEKAPSGVGQRTFWLQQVVEHAALAPCRAAWKVDAGAFLKAVEKSDHAEDLRVALERSASRTRDVELADALLEVGSLDRDVHAVASRAACEASLRRHLRGEAWEAAFHVLSELARERALGPTFQREALEQYAGRLHAATMAGRMPSVNVDAFFSALAPETLPRAEELLQPLLAASGVPARRAQDLLERLALRRAIHEHLP